MACAAWMRLAAMLSLVAAILLPAGSASAQSSGCATAAPGYSKLLLAGPDLRAYWRLSESPPLACDVAGASDGRYAGTYTPRVTGALTGDQDSAVGFSGAGSIRVPSSDALNPTSAIALEAWVKPASLVGSGTILRKDGQYMLRVRDGSAVFRIWTSAGIFELASAPVLRTWSYQHIVAVFSGNVMRLYRNGSQLATRTVDGGMSATGSSLYLGASSGTYDFYAGSLDEVAVHGAPLSWSTMTDHYAAARPPATGSYVGCRYGGFAAGAWPAGCWRPYSVASPFNRPLPATPRSAPDSAAVVNAVLRYGQAHDVVAGYADTAGDFDHPTYWSRPGDPVFRLHCYEETWGRCPIEGFDIRVPDAARAAAGADGHLTVVDQDSGWEYDLYKVRSKPAGGGLLEFRWGGRTRIDGDGLSSGATAANFGNLAGIVRAAELASGQIDHALFATVRCDAGRFVYPARGVGTSCASVGLPVAGAPPMGTRLQLAMTPAEIDALPVPAWKKTILRAMATYGMFVGDTGGGSWGIRLESGSTFTSFGVTDPLVAFAQANGWTPYATNLRVGDLAAGVDWSGRLRVIDTCVTQRTC